MDRFMEAETAEQNEKKKICNPLPRHRNASAHELMNAVGDREIWKTCDRLGQSARYLMMTIY